MAFAPGFIDYAPGPKGGYTFKHEDGRELFFHGPEADQLASDIDRMRPPDTRTASMGDAGIGFGPTPAGTADAIRGFAEQSPLGGPPQAHAAPAAPPDPRDMGPPEGGQPPPAPNTPPPSGPQVVQGQQVNVNDAGMAVGPNGDPFVATGDIGMPQRQYSAGRAAGYTPTTQGRSVEGAKRFSEELREGYADQALAEREAAMAQNDAQQAIFAAQAASANAALPDLLQKEAEAKQKMWIVENHVANSRAKLDQLSQEAADAKLGAPSIFGSGDAAGVASGIGTLISAAFASMGSAILGRGPTGFDVVNSALDRNMQLQRNELQRKGARANNALAQYQREFGDLQTAEAALKVVQLQKAQQMAAQYAALQGSQQSQQQYEQFALGLNKELLKKQQEFEDLAQGKAVESVAMKYDPGSRGGAESDASLMKRRVEWAKGSRELGEFNRDVNTGFSDQKALAPRDQRLERADELGRRIRLPDGTFVYASNPKIYEKAMQVLPAAEDIDEYSKKMEDILNKPFSSLSPGEVGRYKTFSGEMKETVKTLKQLGAALTGPEMSMIDAYTNEEAINKLENPMSVEEARAKLRTVREIAAKLKSRPTRELYMDPDGKQPYQQTEQQQGFVPGGIAEAK